MESIEQGHERRTMSPRLRAVLLASLAGAVIIGVLGWIGDARWREAATDDLAMAFDETLSSIEIAERRVQSVMEYARPARERADVDPAVRASLDDLVRETAIDARADIAIRRQEVAAVTIPPWHAKLLEARERAEEWLDLRAAGISSLVETGRATYPPREEIDAARESLRLAWAGVRGD
jgi:hypothetical protein